jgi:iron complex outermembrane receptor protein
MRYSTKYYSDILQQEDTAQQRFAKVGANVTLYGPDDRWELALIGNNLTNTLVINKCSLSNAANGVNPFLPTPIKGGTIRNAVGVDEAVCSIDAGRELSVCATARF